MEELMHGSKESARGRTHLEEDSQGSGGSPPPHHRLRTCFSDPDLPPLAAATARLGAARRHGWGSSKICEQEERTLLRHRERVEMLIESAINVLRDPLLDERDMARMLQDICQEPHGFLVAAALEHNGWNRRLQMMEGCPVIVRALHSLTRARSFVRGGEEPSSKTICLVALKLPPPLLTARSTTTTWCSSPSAPRGSAAAPASDVRGCGSKTSRSMYK
eukprot:725469-Hanusia_phi.AAC.1